MLTPAQIAAYKTAAEEITRPMTEYLLQDIARRVSEAGQLTSTAAYEVWRAQQLGMSQKGIKKELRRILKTSRKQVNKLLSQSAEAGYNFDISRLGGWATPFAKNAILQQFLDAAIKTVGAELDNITQTIGMVAPDGKPYPLQQAYCKATDYAFEQVSTGVVDYNTAIRQACKNLAQHGLRVIDYESGVHTSIEGAVRRNIMGGLGLLQEQISQDNHDKLGADGWEISAHAASAPDHEPYQGKQYTDEQYEALNGRLARRIGTLNCGHATFPIILGINDPQYTDEQLAEFRRSNADGLTYQGRHYTMYEATQKQNQIERAIQKQKRRVLVDEATADSDKLLTDQIKLRRLNDEYRRYCGATGFPTRSERLQAAGFGRKEARQASSAAEQHYQKWSKEIGVNPSIETLAKYYDVKYNDSPRYALLQGYKRAVEKHDISPLVGFERYERVSEDTQNRIVGTTTATGIRIESFATHFVDRVIGQTSTSHKGMRCGVSIEDVLDTLVNPEKLGAVRHLDDGDVRQTMYGKRAVVTLSIRDKRLIQTNLRGG